MLHFEKTFRYCSYKFCLENTFSCHTSKLRNDHKKCKKTEFCKILQKKKISKNLQQKSCIGFNKVASLNPAALIKKRLRHSCFPMNLSKFLKQSLLLKTKTKLARKCEILLNFVVSKFCKKFFDQRISKNLTVHYSVESIVVLIK